MCVCVGGVCVCACVRLCVCVCLGSEVAYCLHFSSQDRISEMEIYGNMTSASDVNIITEDFLSVKRLLTLAEVRHEILAFVKALIPLCFRQFNNACVCEYVCV